MSVACVLIIDDRPDESAVRALLRDMRRLKVSAKSMLPDEVRKIDLDRADLILVDFKLTEWTRTMSDIAYVPHDGLALAANLRRHIADSGGLPPKAFAIYSAQIDEIASPLPPKYGLHTLARLNHLEWVFPKAQGNIAMQVKGLVDAVRSMPRIDRRYPFNIGAWFGIDAEEEALQNGYFRDIASCYPPIHDLTTWSHGISVVRWMLHRILPYPCFLWDVRRLALRLSADLSALERSLGGKSKLRQVLDKYKYTGPLSKFAGDRWWRTGIEMWLWEATDGRSADRSRVSALVRSLSKGIVKTSRSRDPVLAVDERFEIIANGVSAKDAVRIRPDDWPMFAEQPWMARNLVEANPRLKGLVVADDREALAV